MENYRIKLYIFKLLAFFFLLFGTLNTQAQVLKALVPDGVLMQYAGSIGYGSAGISYDLFHEKGNLDFTYGYVPESKGGSLNIISGKFSYKPFGIKIKDYGKIYVLNPGTFVSYHPGKQFDKWSKAQYPNGYYWWSKAFRIHLSLSTEAKLNGEKLFRKGGIKAIGLYSEVNTNDLYTVSWFKNRDTMSLLDIMRVGYGVRAYF